MVRTAVDTAEPRGVGGHRQEFRIDQAFGGYVFKKLEGILIVMENESGWIDDIICDLVSTKEELSASLLAMILSEDLAGMKDPSALMKLATKRIGTDFQPNGITDDPEIPHTSSLLDYIYRRLSLWYLPESMCASLGILVRGGDPPYCMKCGVEMQRAGTCHACPSCGETSISR